MSISKKSSGNKNEGKLPDSYVDSLVNDFDEEIKFAEDEDDDTSSSSNEDFQLPKTKKKVGLFYCQENQENESPQPGRRNKSSKHVKLKPYYEGSNKYPDASRLLRSKTNEDGEDIYNYNPDDENRLVMKTIMVGGDFQAQVPEGLRHYDDALPYENEDKLIWDPNVLDEDTVVEYLNKAASVNKPFLPMGNHLRDNEQNLYLLQQCGHNIEEALRRLKMNVTVYNEEMSPWSEEECMNFEAGVRAFGKNFYLTQQNKVRTRSVGELVQFYYLWKKSERHDIFANKVRLEKKKYTLHPGVTDFMDRFLEEHDNSTRDRSLSPLSHGGNIVDKKN